MKENLAAKFSDSNLARVLAEQKTPQRRRLTMWNGQWANTFSDVFYAMKQRKNVRSIHLLAASLTTTEILNVISQRYLVSLTAVVMSELTEVDSLQRGSASAS